MEIGYVNTAAHEQVYGAQIKRVKLLLDKTVELLCVSMSHVPQKKEHYLNYTEGVASIKRNLMSSHSEVMYLNVFAL